MRNQKMNLSMHSVEIQKSDSKESVLKKVANSLFDDGMIEDSSLFFTAAMQRESLGNTHIGYGTALVHLINQTVKQEGIFLYYFTSPLNHWHEDEMLPIKLAIVYAIHNEESNNLMYFRKFSSLCADDQFIQQLIDKNLSIETIKKYIFE